MIAGTWRRLLSRVRGSARGILISSAPPTVTFHAKWRRRRRTRRSVSPLIPERCHSSKGVEGRRRRRRRRSKASKVEAVEGLKPSAFGVRVEHAFDAVLHNRNVEVHQEADPHTGELQI